MLHAPSIISQLHHAPAQPTHSQQPNRRPSRILSRESRIHSPARGLSHANVEEPESQSRKPPRQRAPRGRPHEEEDEAEDSTVLEPAREGSEKTRRSRRKLSAQGPPSILLTIRQRLFIPPETERSTSALFQTVIYGHWLKVESFYGTFRGPGESTPPADIWRPRSCR